jgi:exonuclease SbcD
VEQNLSVFAQVLDLCKQLGVNIVKHAGDVFTSRKGQPQIVTNTFKKILDSYAEAEVRILAIPGNHDKTSYVEEESFLTAFDGHPALTVMTGESIYNVGDVDFYFLPYYDEHLMYPVKLKNVLEQVVARQTPINILITHCAIDGVVNNGGSQVKGELPRNSFSAFRRVFVGHYHNRQTFDNDRIVYIGSTDSRNFGEDPNKGCVVLYNDGSYEFVGLQFKPHVTVDLLASDLTIDVIAKVKQKTEEATVRFRIEGQLSESLKPMVAQLDECGVKIEVHREVVIGAPDLATQTTFTLNDIATLYDQWTKDRSIPDPEYGKELLNHFGNVEA